MARTRILCSPKHPACQMELAGERLCPGGCSGRLTAPSYSELEIGSAVANANISGILVELLEKVNHDVISGIFRRRSKRVGSSKGSASVGVENAYKAVVNGRKKNLRRNVGLVVMSSTRLHIRHATSF